MSDKILVIEDNPITRKLLLAALAADGFEVSAVGRAAEVDSALQAVAPDLVLLDLMLPDATGFDVLARLRATPGTERVPVLAVSGLADGDRILGAGFTDHLLKPIEPSRLVDRIRLHLRAAQGSRPGLQRILVVDDDPVQRKLTELTLGSCGFEVASAREAFEALTLAREFKPDVIVSDIVMPGVDGFQLCRAIRLEPELAGIPVVLASSRELDRADRDLGARAGASAMVTRTADLGDLTAAIREHVALRSCARTVTRPELPSNLHREVIGDLERQADRDADAARATRTWNALLAMLERVCDLPETSRDLGEFFDQLLAVLLDASWFSLGLIYTCDGGSLALRSDLGFSRTTSPGPGEFFGQPGMLHHVIDGQRPVALDRSSLSQTVHRLLAGAKVGSMLLVPLARRGTPLGIIVLASMNTTVPHGWLELTRAMAGPIVQAIAVMGMAAPIRPEPPLADVVDLMEPSDLARMANRDAVTGLLNRDRFMEVLDSRLAEARRYGTTGALVLIDLEQLGRASKLFGRAIWEAGLRSVSDTLASSTRGTDIRARLRDDQFGVILLHTSSAAAEICANKLLARLEATTVTCEGVTLPIGASIGVAVFSAQGASQREILATADDALYRAKLGGGRRVCVHDANDVVTRIDLADIAAQR
jgi:diguanylate cyclase (GGDEF)-like protein